MARISLHVTISYREPTFRKFPDGFARSLAVYGAWEWGHAEKPEIDGYVGRGQQL
jgi:hypothetical protein